jgi:aminopeptidase N
LDELTSFLNPTEKQPDYGIFSSNKDILNLGLWYVALSKFDEDGWDEEAYAGIGDVSYFDPSSFNVRITAPAAYQVVTTGSAIKKVPGKEGKLEHQVESKLTRDFVIELSKEFEQKSAIRGQTSIRSYYLTKHRGSGEKVLETALRAFEYFYSEFGPYPYTELDVVEAPLYGGAGGVEFPGLVTVSSMLYKGDEMDTDLGAFEQLLNQSPAFDQLLEFVVAHEVAHQWWNAVVGSNSKKYPFIDEAMANYSAVLYFEHYYGREAAEKQMAMQMKINYQMHRMLGGSDQPVLLPASAYNGPLEYSAIVYGKGALGFDNIRKAMGDEAFFAALKKYYKKFSFQTAGPYDFKEVAQSIQPNNKEKLELTFKRWMEEEHGDEDIGQGSLESLLATIMEGNSTGSTIDEQQIMKEFEKLLNDIQTPPQ